MLVSIVTWRLCILILSNQLTAGHFQEGRFLQVKQAPVRLIANVFVLWSLGSSTDTDRRMRQGIPARTLVLVQIKSCHQKVQARCRRKGCEGGQHATHTCDVKVFSTSPMRAMPASASANARAAASRARRPSMRFRAAAMSCNSIAQLLMLLTSSSCSRSCTSFQTARSALIMAVNP